MKLLDDFKAAYFQKKCNAVEHFSDSVKADWSIIESCDNMTEMEKLDHKQVSINKRHKESNKMIEDWSDNIMNSITRMSVRVVGICIIGIATVAACHLYVDWIVM